MQFRLGGDLGRILEEEADKRGISGATLAKTIIGDWVRDDYKKRMKGRKRPQNQSLVATEGSPGSEPTPVVPDRNKKGEATSEKGKENS
jgi:hypothetical protein